MTGLLMTTEQGHNLPIMERLGIASGQCVVGLNALRDLTALFKDWTGQRLDTAEQKYEEARLIALEQVQHKALEMGGDAVIALSISYGELTGGDKAMLTCFATGTVVRLRSSIT